MMNAARRVRSKSPFRPSRSKSPFGNDRRALSPFARRRRSQSEAVEESEGGLHESEINIFQQLCLDRYDDSVAIEILLEESAEKALFKPEVPDLYTASSGSSDPSSRALSKETIQSRGTNTTRGSTTERKKPFFKRLFKSPRKHSTDELTKFPSTPCNSLPESQSSGPSEEMNYLPKPPSGVPKSREPVNLPPPVPVSKRVLSDKLDTFSNMSSISGSHVTGLKPPVHFDRQESLGTESIKDIRKALKGMEKQLVRATNKGERVSRQKVMRALFTVADSLEDMEERDVLRSELEGMMRTERANQTTDARPLTVTSSDDEKSDMTTSDDDDDEDYAESQAPSSQPSVAPTGLFSSVGRLFGMSNDEKVAVGQALDDLLWTEFVATRKATKANSKENRAPGSGQAKAGSHNRQKLKAQQSRQGRADKDGKLRVASDRKRETLRHAIDSTPFNEGRRLPLEPRRVDSNEHIHRARSWWRKHPTSQRSSLRRESDEEEEEEEDDDDDESYSSDEFPNYLPTSITVQKRNGGRRANVRNSIAPSSNPRYKVNLVETESRYGYEMGSTTSSMR
jgi:hypothetical protein